MPGNSKKPDRPAPPPPPPASNWEARCMQDRAGGGEAVATPAGKPGGARGKVFPPPPHKALGSLRTTLPVAPVSTVMTPGFSGGGGGPNQSPRGPFARHRRQVDEWPVADLRAA
uniref:Uncharacterized protein n=1 Tax=Sphaerodactylus townsendi TaxID=933632 RepID=A0ACB8ENV8_9SAUR